MSVKKDKRKKAKKKQCDERKKSRDESEAGIKAVFDPELGQKERQAIKESAGVLLTASLLPLKLEISDEKKECVLTSFIFSARLKSDRHGFLFEITKPYMKSSDYVCLMKTLYKNFVRLCR